MKEFCVRLKELRIENNYSTVKLANLLQVNHSTITRWENGMMLPSIDHLYNMSKLFGVSADYLIGLED